MIEHGFITKSCSPSSCEKEWRADLTFMLSDFKYKRGY